MNFTRWLFEQEQITVYHGSRQSNLDQINANSPAYEGGLGHGVYVGMHPETADFYGEYIYEMQTKFGWESILGIGHPDGDNYIPIEEREGNSILIGESVPAFAFEVKGKRYGVVTGKGWPNQEDEEELARYGELISLEDVGEVVKAGGYKAVYVVGIRYHASVNEEMLVFDPGDLALQRRMN